MWQAVRHLLNRALSSRTTIVEVWGSSRPIIFVSDSGRVDYITILADLLTAAQ